MATERLHKRNVSKVAEGAWEYAKNKLTAEQWSPEQITGRRQSEGKPSISHETIYQRILLDKLSEVAASLRTCAVRNNARNVMAR